MTSPSPPCVDWRAAQREDREIIRTFPCALPWPKRGLRKYPIHPQHWEWQAQARIREAKPPRPATEILSLGFAGTSLVAVVWTLVDVRLVSELFRGAPRVDRDRFRRDLDEAVDQRLEPRG